jgi:hypothetical protein
MQSNEEQGGAPLSEFSILWSPIKTVILTPGQEYIRFKNSFTIVSIGK